MNQVALEMDKKSLDWLYDYVETSHFSTELYKVVENYRTNHDILYRGIMYQKALLEVGYVYEHDYLITSWTTKNDIAVDFSVNKDLPNWAYEESYYQKYGEAESFFAITADEKKEIESLYCSIVLILKDENGVDVNTHISEHDYQNEHEVILYEGKWKIKTIHECVSVGKTYFEVELEKFSA